MSVTLRLDAPFSSRISKPALSSLAGHFIRSRLPPHFILKVSVTEDILSSMKNRRCKEIYPWNVKIYQSGSPVFLRFFCAHADLGEGES